MSKHLAKDISRHAAPQKPQKKGQKRRKKEAGLPAWLRLYPDSTMDRDGYELSLPWGLTVLAALALSITAQVLGGTRGWLQIGLWVAAFLAAAAWPLYNLFLNVLHGRVICEGLPVLLAGIICMSLQMYLSGIWILLFLDAAKAVELLTLRNRQKRAQKLMDILPREAYVLVNGEEQKFKPAHLHKGDVVVVREKTIIPIDGVVRAGMSSIDESPLTNREETTAVAEGSRVRMGCINVSKPLIIEAECEYADCAAQKLYAGFTAMMKRQCGYEMLTEKVCTYVLPAMLACALFFGAVVPLFSHRWADGLKLAAVCLLAASPYGLPGCINLASFTGLTDIFSAGIWIRDIRLTDRLARLEAFMCNKTGTVTEAHYTVQEVCPENEKQMNADALAEIAAKVESASQHPIAAAIRRYAGLPEGEKIEGLEVEEIPTKGLVATVDGNTILVGNATLLFEHEIYCKVPEGQGVPVHVAVNGTYCGYLMLENPVRPGNWEAIEQMRACGVKSFAMLSGDLRSAVRPIAGGLNFNIVRGELTDEGKASAADYLMGNRTKGRTIAYAGNGCAELDSARHTDVAVVTGALHNGMDEHADVNIMAEGFTAFPTAVRAAHNTARLALTALITFSVLHLGAVLLALFGICPALLAAAAFSLGECALYALASVLFDRL